MACVDVHTQAELDAALADGNHPHCLGSARFEAWGSAHVEAWESAHVEARGSAHVEARESAHVVAWESAHVVASRFVAVHRHGHWAQITGGVVIPVERPTTVAAWCEFYGVPVADGVARLYKAVRDDYRSGYGLLYAPGSTPEAPDWDGGRAECGGGLHFSPHPAMALSFDYQATRFVACPVALADMRPPSPADVYPAKIKARRVCGPIEEVDRRGRVIAPTLADRAPDP